MWTLILLLVLIVAALVLLPSLRIRLLSAPLMRLAGRMLPQMGETERIALEAGTVWWDAELLSGRPDWDRLFHFAPRGLRDDERAFLAGPVEDICNRLDEWEISQKRALPDEIWDQLKADGFFGMIIPREYGGLGFSAIGHSEVVLKLASRSIPASVIVMVPNSLGPAELLLHYGTEAQKNHYLPRLARGEDIPCFALTEPHAGSDAAATRSGVTPDQLATGFASFQGIKRRQEVLGEPGGVTVLDDFAHHPTAVDVTLRALRQRFGGRRLWAIWEPRSATSRRNIFQEAYGRAFDVADQVVIAAPYDQSRISEDERFSSDALVQALTARGVDACTLPDVDAIAATVVARALPHDVVAVLSNGGFGGLHGKLLDGLQERFGEAG